MANTSDVINLEYFLKQISDQKLLNILVNNKILNWKSDLNTDDEKKKKEDADKAEEARKKKEKEDADKVEEARKKKKETVKGKLNQIQNPKKVYFTPLIVDMVKIVLKNTMLACRNINRNGVSDDDLLNLIFIQDPRKLSPQLKQIKYYIEIEKFKQNYLINM